MTEAEYLDSIYPYTEEYYKELSELYNWDVIDCVFDDKEKTIEEIHKEIIELLKSKGII